MNKRDIVREIDKAIDTVVAAVNHHVSRDKSNASLHLAGNVRHSPLTSALLTTAESLRQLRNTLTDEWRAEEGAE